MPSLSLLIALILSLSHLISSDELPDCSALFSLSRFDLISSVLQGNHR